MPGWTWDEPAPSRYAFASAEVEAKMRRVTVQCEDSQEPRIEDTDAAASQDVTRGA